MTDIEELKKLIKDGQKIQAIKKLREKDGLSLKDAKEKVEELQELLAESGEIQPPSKSGCMLWFIGIGVIGGGAVSWLL